MSPTSNSTRPMQGPPDTAPAFNVVMFVLQVFATSIVVFLRHGFGSRYLGIHGVLVFILVPLFSLLFPEHDLRPLLQFLPVYLGACAMHALRRLSRRSKTRQIHSYYGGRPLLLRLLRRQNEVLVKRILEPVVVVLVGFAIAGMNLPLGMYITVAGICLFSLENIKALWEAQQVLDLNDAVIDQQQRAEWFRHIRGER